MQKAHSFFVPALGCLVDAAGLFAHLQERSCRRHTCVFCARVFGGVEACRNHMVDKAHCKLNLDDHEEVQPSATTLASALGRTFPVPSLYLPCTFPVPSLYRRRPLWLRRSARWACDLGEIYL
jgi:hypothetical protein